MLLTPTLRRTWALRGHTPIIKERIRTAWHRQKVSIAGAFLIAPDRTQLGFFFKTLINDYFNSFNVAAFLEALLKHLGRHSVIIVWDRGQIHTGEFIREIQQVFRGRLSLEKLPPYAPILNPTESVWSWLKYGRLCNFAPHDAWELNQRVAKELCALQKNQELLRGLLLASELALPRALLI